MCLELLVRSSSIDSNPHHCVNTYIVDPLQSRLGQKVTHLGAYLYKGALSRIILLNSLAKIFKSFSFSFTLEAIFDIFSQCIACLWRFSKNCRVISNAKKRRTLKTRRTEHHNLWCAVNRTCNGFKIYIPLVSEETVKLFRRASEIQNKTNKQTKKRKRKEKKSEGLMFETSA